MITLSLESENGAVLTYRLAKGQITVGSSSRNDVVIKSPGVAERHLMMARSGDVHTFVTIDRQTVVLNGERRSRGVLNPGDRLRIGGATLVFRSGDSAGVEPDEVQVKATPPPLTVTTPRDGGEPVIVRADPAGYPNERARLVELLRDASFGALQQVVTVLKEAFPGVEVVLLETPEVGESSAIASVWSGELPKVSAEVLTGSRLPVDLPS